MTIESGHFMNRGLLCISRDINDSSDLLADSCHSDFVNIFSCEFQAGHTEDTLVDGRRRNSSDDTSPTSSRHHGTVENSSAKTKAQQHRTTSVTVTAMGAGGDSCLQSPGDSGRALVDEEIAVPEAGSSVSRITADCTAGTVIAQATGNSPGEIVDKAVAVKGDGSDAKTAVHVHETDDSLLDNAADIEMDSRWQNFAGDRVPEIDSHSPRDYKSIQENVCLPTVSESACPAGETLPQGDSGAAEVAINRRRRISAARCALYHRLLSETGGSSDVDESSDIFDVQSLCSDDDDADSDASDVNILSDQSYLVR